MGGGGRGGHISLSHHLRLIYLLHGETLPLYLCPLADPTQSPIFHHKVVEKTSGSAAVDVVLIVSATEGQIDHQRWLQIAVPILESRLTSLGIGLEEDTPNRYALVQFGGRGLLLKAQFLRVSGEVFFPASSFVSARRQLNRGGTVADSYQAINFAMRNSPFRNETNITRLAILVTNKDRHILPDHQNITELTLNDLLNKSGVLFDVIVSANLSIRASAQSLATAVLGLTSRNKGILVTAGDHNNGTYQFITGEAMAGGRGSVVDDHVNFALDVGGQVWSLGMLAGENVTVLESTIAGMMAGHELEQVTVREECERCWCGGDHDNEGEERGGGGGEREECEDEMCEVAEDQEMCSCLVNLSPSEVKCKKKKT